LDTFLLDGNIFNRNCQEVAHLLGGAMNWQCFAFYCTNALISAFADALVFVCVNTLGFIYAEERWFI